VYNVLAVCQASIDDLKYSKKKKRKARSERKMLYYVEFGELNRKERCIRITR